MILMFTILKIHYNRFWLEFLNKYTIVYSEIRFSKNLYRIETIFTNQTN